MTGTTNADRQLASALRATLDGSYHDLREQAREDLQPEWICAPTSESIDEARDRVTGQLLTLAEHGYGRVGFPTDYGGSHDYGASCVLFEMQALGDLSLLIKLGVQFGLFGGAVARLGTERIHSAYLEAIQTGRILGSFAMTEIGHGSNVQAIETTATYDSGTRELVIHSPTPSATKTYIGNAAKDAHLAVVFAQLSTPDGDHGVHAVLVPIRDPQTGEITPGVTIGDNGPKGGLPGVDNGTFTFDQVRVPATMLLGAFGDIGEDGHYVSAIDNPNRRFFTMLGTLVRGRICVGGGAGAAAKKALAIAIRYGDQRRQFAAPGESGEQVILDYLAHQRRLLPRLATTVALTFAQNDLIDRLQELQGTALPDGEDISETDQRELETRVAGIKAVITWHGLDTVQACREACGGAGYMAENQLTQLRADVDVFTTFEGDNTVLLQLVAKSLLTEYQETFGDISGPELAGLVTKQVAEGLVERTTGRAGLQRLIDIAKGRGDDSAMDDHGWQLSMFEQRADHGLETLGRRLRRATGDDAFDVFNGAQDHLLFAARAHIDRCVMEAAVEAVDAMPEGEARDLMSSVISLYALSSIEADKGWFLEHGRLNTTRSRLVTASVNDLCRALRPHALTLVDAFGIPEALITAPIATGQQTASSAPA